MIRRVKETLKWTKNKDGDIIPHKNIKYWFVDALINYILVNILINIPCDK